ncbi:MAG: HlyD family efflux transporter periplasmic adaptor subunit [Anaerolineae bacterium]|nr:efflux RND transporter periplasmic adaptor subunit [Thermoflexales bacterium]HQW34390.1 efflux RND transporter periplasmic adaptor subunit [Thermoflexales bacterium]
MNSTNTTRPARRILPLLLIAAVIAGGVYAYSQSQKQIVNATTSNLGASGTIEARTVNVAAEVAGRVIESKIEEGQPVKAGQVLAKLDDASLQAQYAQAKAAVQAAQANYDLLAAGPTPEQVKQAQAALMIATANYSRTIGGGRDSDVAAAQAALNAASAAYAKVKGGATTEDIAVVEASMRSAKAALDTAQFAYDNAFRQNPAAIGASPTALALQQATNAYAAAKAQYDKVTKPADAAQLAAAYQQVESTRAALEKVNGQARDFDIASAQAQIQQAQAALDALNNGPRPQQLDAAKAQIASAQAVMQGIEVQLKKTIIAAPMDGVLLTRNIEPGEMASPGAAVFSIGRLDTLELVVYLPEDRFALVKQGQAATVHVDAYSGRDFAATVLRIADKAEFTPRNVSTADGRKDTVYAVTLSIANPDNALKAGMPADVTFSQK